MVLDEYFVGLSGRFEVGSFAEVGLLVELCLGGVYPEGELVAGGEGGGLVLLEGVGSALPHLFLDALEVAEVDLVLPVGVDFGQLLALEEDVRALVAGLEFVIFGFVLAADEV